MLKKLFNVQNYINKTGLITAIIVFAGFLAASIISLIDEKIAVVSFICFVIGAILIELLVYRLSANRRISDNANCENPGFSASNHIFSEDSTTDSEFVEKQIKMESSEFTSKIEVSESTDIVNHDDKNELTENAKKATDLLEEVAIEPKYDENTAKKVIQADEKSELNLKSDSIQNNHKILENAQIEQEENSFTFTQTISCLNISENLKTEFVDLIEEKLIKYNHSTDFISPVVYVFSEIWDNALKHGCQQDSPEIIVEFTISEEKFSITIKDNGLGFNYSEKIEELENRTDLESENGRGLLSIKSICDSVEINEQGNEVTAVLLKNRFITNENLRIFNLPEMVDSQAFDELENEFKNSINNGEILIIVDFDNVKYICSSMFSVLVNTFEEIKKDNGIIVLANVNEEIKRILDGNGLNDYFLIFQTVEEAAAHITELK